MSSEAKIIAKGDGGFTVIWSEQVEDRWELYGRDFQTRNEAAAFVRSKGMDVESAAQTATREAESVLDPTLDFVTGVAYTKAEHWDDAARSFESAARGNPNDAQTRHYLGVAYCRLERLDEGARELELAVKLDPDAAEAHHHLGIAYIQQGHTEEAAREFETVVKLQPDDGAGHYMLALAYGALRRFPESIREARRAVDLGHGPAQELLDGAE
jgi:Tfp pilus assembly protein PilF